MDDAVGIGCGIIVLAMSAAVIVIAAGVGWHIVKWSYHVAF